MIAMVVSLDLEPPFEHRYFASYPVESERTASWFSKKLTFAIMDLLWKAGPRGLSPKEVHERLAKEKQQKVGWSIVYQTLKGLYDNEKVEKEWDNEIGANRYVLTEKLLPAFLDEDFEKWADEHFKKKIETTLFPVFLDYLRQIIKLAQERRVPNNFLPKQGKEGWCHNPKCLTSHEAEFFFLALLYQAACSFVYSPSEWKFTDKSLEAGITSLYTDNKLADPKGLRTPP